MSLTAKRMAEFEELVVDLMQEHQAPGMSIAIAQGEQLLYTKAFGYRNKEKQIPTTTDTIFGVASITKVFTGLAVAQLVEQGKLSFSDPVVKHLPQFRMPGCGSDHRNPGGGEDVKVWHLLSHTSGLPALPSLGITFKAHSGPDMVEQVVASDSEVKKIYHPRPPINTYSELVKHIADFPAVPLGAPGEFLNYSNEGFALLGAIIMKVSGVPYAQYVRDNLLKPLGLNRTTYSFEEMFEHEDVTDLYTLDSNGELLASTRWPCAPAFQAAGRMKSCSTDVIRVFQALAGKGSFGGSRILSADGVREQILPRHKYTLNEIYTYGLKIFPGYQGMTLVEHGGAGKGISAHGGFVPETEISAVVLCNLTGVPVVKAWHAAINLASCLALDTPRMSYQTSVWTENEASSLVGRYRSGEGADIVINAKGESLTMTTKTDTSIVERINETTGLLKLKGQDIEVRFYLDAAGRAWGMGQGVRIIPRVD